MGFVFHPHQPDLVYGITPDGPARLSALLLAPDVANAARAHWNLPDDAVPGGAPSLTASSSLNLLPRERCMLSLDHSSSTVLCWFDAAKTHFTFMKMQP